MAFIKELREYLQLKTIVDVGPILPLYPFLEKGQHLLFWGVSEHCCNFKKILSEINLSVSAIVDNCKKQQQSSFCSIPVIDPGIVKGFQPCFIIIASIESNKAIAKQLKKMGFLKDIGFVEHPLLSEKRESKDSLFYINPPNKQSLSKEKQNLIDNICNDLFPLLFCEKDSLGWVSRNKFLNKHDFRRPY